MVLVPFGPLRWYRLVRYDGTDCSATVVPIRPLRWYRLTDTITKQSCDELLDIIKTHKEKLWLPYQVGMEFFNNRLSVIEGIRNGFNKLLANLSKTEDVLNESLKFNEFKSDTAHNIEQLRIDIKNFRKREVSKVKAWQKEFEDNDKEVILKEILKLYDGKVGDDYSSDLLDELYKDGDKRFKESIPPGYADWNEKIKHGIRHACGDLIWWKQAIDYARDNKCDLIIVTDDKKEDWWYKVSGKTIGPRVELIREFNKETNGQSFIMYKTHQFMEMAKELDGAVVSDSSIREAESTGSTDYRQFIDMLGGVTDPLVDSSHFKYPWMRINTPEIAGASGTVSSVYPYGIQGLPGAQGVTGASVPLGFYDSITGLTYPKENEIHSLADFYAQHPDGKMAFPKVTDSSSMWFDYISKKKDDK